MIRNSEKTSASVYDGGPGSRESTASGAAESEIRAAINAVLREARQTSGDKSAASLAATAGAAGGGLPWNPTRNVAARPAKTNQSTSTAAKSDPSRGKSTPLDEPIQSTGAAKPRKPNVWDLTGKSAKRGYYTSRLGQEAWKAMQGQDNELDKYTKLLASEEFNFEAEGWLGKIVSNAAEQAGGWGRQMTDPDTLAMAATAGSMAFWAGQAGPQVLAPEEIVTVPAAVAAGMTAGTSKTSMEIEGGLTYLELLENGVSETTARTIATCVGAVNAGLEALQLDELLEAYKILDKAGADDNIRTTLIRELTKRGVDALTETAQEDLQELTTIAGAQIGSKLDTGEWAYTGREMAERLRDTTKASLIGFGLTNAVAAGHNVHTQSLRRLAAQGEKNCAPVRCQPSGSFRP